MASRRATDRVLQETIFPRLARELSANPLVLNVGILCGNTTPFILKEFFPSASYKTLDRDPTLRPDFCADLQNADGLVSQIGRFDLIIVTAVFFLLDDPDRAFANLVACLKPGGHCIVEMDAFNNRGERFACESHTRDLDMSRYISADIVRQPTFSNRYAIFCEYQGLAPESVPVERALSYQHDRRSNAQVWSVDTIFSMPGLQVVYNFNNDEERMRGCSFLIDAKRLSVDALPRRGYILSRYAPPALRFRRLIQACSRSVWYGRLVARWAAKWCMAVWRFVSCRIFRNYKGYAATTMALILRRCCPQKGFLIRVDDFPCLSHPLESFKKFDAIMREHAAPYLVAATPYESFFSKGEQTRIKAGFDCLQERGIAFGLHGFTHERGELDLLRSEHRLDAMIESTLREIAHYPAMLPVFVPPFNALYYDDYIVLRKYFKIITGGPESIQTMGFLPPFSLGNVWYLPSYWGYYGTAQTIRDFLLRTPPQRWSFCMPLTLHWTWEADNDFTHLRALLKLISGSVVDWRGIVPSASALDRFRAQQDWHMPAEPDN